ncbi:hypothetical protein CHD5UKE2_040 [Escherichia phage vB_EcoS-CHD5UKE2]|uniref:Uncharacterized protein n=1 Tax=Escherichia phage vB_EcoS-CHD5UKE2 TaxID=2865806 RepID=A0A9E7MJK7_9CAUD|nr:hypothetical protein P9604_gp39 [Escherichia phage vB_EcoS-CHD5UKE2]USL86365.1 hypothetical protein CHD5UKE2_040 [Escherichia phage vB_EcoS-CHD5UKE2]
MPKNKRCQLLLYIEPGAHACNNNSRLIVSYWLAPSHFASALFFEISC